MVDTVTTTADPVRRKSYVVLLFITAIVGLLVSALAYYFLLFITNIQVWVFTDIPKHFTSHTMTTWWPLIPLVVAGLIVGLTIKCLPGTGGEVPIEGFNTSGGTPSPKLLPGIAIAALASIGLGVVVGPEAPLIALGGGVALLAVKLVKRDIPSRAGAIIAAAGSFAAVSALFGNPLIGAFLMLEVSGLSGPTLELVLVPGLLASGIGYLLFVGLGSFTGHGTLSLTVPSLPPVGGEDAREILWATLIGLIAPILILCVRAIGTYIRPYVERRIIPVTVLIAIVIGLLAVAFGHLTGRSYTYILFSGQDQLGKLIAGGAGFSVGTLLLIILLKGIAYGASLVAFRGGPTFPAMFLGAVLGILIAHIVGFPIVAGVAIGIGAMTVAMLNLPFVSVLLATLILGKDGVTDLPIIIIGVVVSFVLSTWTRPLVNNIAMPTAATKSGTAKQAITGS